MWPVAMVWNRQSSKRGMVSVALLHLVAKGFGFVREMLVAYFFGASALVDAFRIGETVNSLGSGALASALQVAGVPLLVERNRKGGAATRRLFGSLFTLGLLASGAMGVGIGFLAPWLVRVFAPKASAVTLSSACVMARVMVPVSIGITLLGLAKALYSSRRQFAVSQSVEPLVSLAAIAALLVFARSSGILALGAGWSIGYLLALGAALTPLLLSGFRLVLSLRDPGIREFLTLALPLAATAIVTPLNTAVGRAFASTLAPGSIAALGYATKLYLLPASLAGAAVVTVHFTRAAEMAAAARISELRSETVRLVYRLGLVLVPLSIAMTLLSRPIVGLVYQRGAFDATAAAATAQALAWFSIGLFPLVSSQVITASFRGKKDTKTPVLAAVAGALVNIAFDLLLVRPMGIPGLALAATAGITVTAAFLWLRLARWQIPGTAPSPSKGTAQ